MGCEMNKVTLKLGDNIGFSENDTNYKIVKFTDKYLYTENGWRWGMTDPFYNVNGVEYAREDIIVPYNELAGIEVNVKFSHPFSDILVNDKISVHNRQPEILSPSQPNMRVGGWVKCIYSDEEIKKGKYYQIKKTYKLWNFKFDVNTSNNRTGSDFGLNKNKFSSRYFDCDNALPYNPDELPVQIPEEIKTTTENNVSVPELDMVNNPPHYNQFPMELKDWNFAVIETIKDKHYAAYFKTVSEYLHRAHLKNGVEDLEKAVFWLQDCIEHVKNKQMEVK